MPAQATHKGRHHWTRWSGTPADITEIVTLAKKLTEADENAAQVALKVVAQAWESDFDSADDLLEVEADDLQDIESVEARIHTSGPLGGRRISLIFKRPVERQPRDAPTPKVVSLNVAGPERQWVEETTRDLTKAIDAGIPTSAVVERYVFVPSFVVLVVGLILTIIGGDQGIQWLKVTGLVLLGIGGAAVILTVLMSSFVPRLEILPEGAQTRRSRVLRWTQREAAWLARNVFLIVLGFGIAVLWRRVT